MFRIFLLNTLRRFRRSPLPMRWLGLFLKDE
jgi:hypothetical protein